MPNTFGRRMNSKIKELKRELNKTTFALSNIISLVNRLDLATTSLMERSEEVLHDDELVLVVRNFCDDVAKFCPGSSAG